jgi:iron(III) transport system permease protein
VRGNARWLTALVMLFAACAALPVLAIVTRGLAPGTGATWIHLANTVLPGYVANTLMLVVLVALGAAVGGTASGWLIARRRFPGSGFLEWALMLPLAMPSYVMAYAYTDFLQYAGPMQTALRATFGWSRQDYWFPDVRSLGGAATMFVFALYPYVYLLARTAFIERPPALMEAARTLGLNRSQAFWRVELPLARPAIAAGTALVLMETLADYGTVAYFAVDTFTTGIYRAWFSLGDRAAAAQLATALLAFVILAVALERASRGARRSSGGPRGKQASRFAPARLTGLRGWGATIICGIPLLVGFVLPGLMLLRLLFADTQVVLTDRFLGWAWNSLRVALLASVLAVVAATLVAYAARLGPGVVTRIGSRVLTLGYAVPGTVLAVGVLLPLGALDNWLADVLHDGTVQHPGLLLTGTVFALVYAYLVRYFAVAWNSIEPGFTRITPAMDAAARGLGAGVVGTLLRVHAPLLGRSAMAALLLVFVDVMKELPATLVLRPFNFDTLATQAYMLAKDERLAEAALPSLAIVVVGLVPLLTLARMARRSPPARADKRPAAAAAI